MSTHGGGRAIRVVGLRVDVKGVVFGCIAECFWSRWMRCVPLKVHVRPAIGTCAPDVPGTFSRSARTAKSKIAVAHRLEMGELFPSILETNISTTRTPGPMLKNLDGDLNKAMLLVPDVSCLGHALG